LFKLFINPQGIDITEAFEAYHITDKASKVLPKFYVRDAIVQRNYKLTFNEDGFYRTLKRRVAEKMETIDRSVTWKPKAILIIDLILLFVTSTMALRVGNVFIAFPLLLVSGFWLACLNSIAHNFIHQKNNWFMYTSNMCLIGWRDWRIFHGIVSFFLLTSVGDYIMHFFPSINSHITCIPILTPILRFRYLSHLEIGFQLTKRQSQSHGYFS
jgi:hypothetical protein